MILYFSSTGNSLSIAKQIGERFNEAVVSISEAVSYSKIEDRLIGLVYPVHNYDMPLVVQRFVEKLDFSSAEYIFGIVNHGGDIGNSMYTFKRLLLSKGLELSYSNELLMPVNSRIMYGQVTTLISERTKVKNALVEDMVDDISSRKMNAGNLREKKLWTLASSAVNAKFLQPLIRPSVNVSDCIACDKCVAVCPVSAISIVEDSAQIDGSCVSCMSCVHCCPKQAILVGNRSVRKDQQYRHPEIAFSELKLR